MCDRKAWNDLRAHLRLDIMCEKNHLSPPSSKKIRLYTDFSTCQISVIRLRGMFKLSEPHMKADPFYAPGSDRVA